MQEFSPNSAQKLYFYPFSTHCEPFFLIFASKNKEKRPKAPLFFTNFCSRRRSRRFLFGLYGVFEYNFSSERSPNGMGERIRLADGTTAKKKEPACFTSSRLVFGLAVLPARAEPKRGTRRNSGEG